MAKLVAVLATTHHPFYLKTSQLPADQAPPFAAEWVAKVAAYRETLTRARPDVLVMVGSDHFHQLWFDNMPQFLVGKAPFYDANYYNEEREFGLPKLLLKGDEELSAYILREGIDRGFDLAYSNELRVDHSITCPIFTVRPQNDLPIVPIYTNIFAPPMPRPERFVALGQNLREIIESWPSHLRVAMIGTGHLSLELGGPRQFGEHRPRPRVRPAGRRVDRQRRHRGLPARGHPRQPALAGQRHPRVHGLHAHDGRRRKRQGRLRRHARPVPHHGGLLHLVPRGSRAVSKYLVNKFLYMIDREPEHVERYRTDPAGTVAWWEQEKAGEILNLPSAEHTTWFAFTDV